MNKLHACNSFNNFEQPLINHNMKALLLLFSFLSFGAFAQTSIEYVSKWNNSELSNNVRIENCKAAIEIYFDSVQYENVISLADELKLFAIENDEPQEKLYALKVIRNVHNKTKNYEKVIVIDQMLARIYQQNGEYEKLIDAYNDAGVASFNWRQFEKAILYYKKAIEICEQIENDKRKALLLINISNAELKLGRTKESEKLLIESLSLTDDTTANIQSYTNLGIVNNKLGNYAEAVNYFKRNIELLIAMNNQRSLAYAAYNLGNSYMYLGLQEKSKEAFEMALSAGKLSENDRIVMYSQYNLVNISFEQDNAEETIQPLYDLLASAEKVKDVRMQITTNISLSTSFEKLNDFTKAKQHAQRAADLSSKAKIKDEEALAYMNLAGLSEKLRDYDMVIQYAKEMNRIALDIGNDYFQLQSNSLLFKAYKSQGDNQQAKKYLYYLMENRNIDIETNYVLLPEDDKIQFFQHIENDNNNFYEFMNHNYLVYPDLLENAYDITLRNKGLLLRSSQALRTSINESSNQELIELFDKWIELKKQISNAAPEEEVSLKKEAGELEAKLINMSTEFSQFNQISKFNWKDIQLKLEENQKAIEFIQFTTTNEEGIKDQFYGALILDKNTSQPTFVPLFSETELETVIGKGGANNYNYIDALYNGSKLYNLVWKPLEDKKLFVEGDELIISATGYLHKIAFAGLKKKKKFLSELYTIRMLNSTVTLLLQEDAVLAEDYNYAVYGAIDYNCSESKNEVWKYLPGTLEEVNLIKSILPDEEFVLRSGCEATEAQFKVDAQTANILHVATHGFFFADPDIVAENREDNSEIIENITFRSSAGVSANEKYVTHKNPLRRSGIVFSNVNTTWTDTIANPENDGVLTAQEVGLMNFKNLNLVVLSACETGLGDIQGSEGVFGLQRSFKISGAKNMLMSLWEVPDNETALFMKTFYYNLNQGESIRNAFESTQKELSQEYDAYFWAGFVLLQ